MELDPQDRDVVKLLTKLKNADVPYPLDLFDARRQNYIRRVADIGVGLGAAAGLKGTVKSGGFIPTASSLIETALVVVIGAQTGVAAYFYQEKIKETLQSIFSSPRAEEVISTPSIQSPLSEIPMIALVTPTLISTETVTSAPTVTPSAELAEEIDNRAGNGQLTATPDPKKNNGNHFGQTPKPERTKQPDKDPKPSKTPRK